MIRHIFLLAYRNFLRDKTSFLINLVGLSTGLACVLFIYLWITDEMRYDRFHTHEDRLYQVMKNSQVPGDDIWTFEWTPGPLAQALKEEFPEVLYSVGVVLEERAERGIIQVDDKRRKEIGIRKILGASVSSIVGLLSKEFLMLVVLAFIIASPISWYLIENWLQQFAYRISVPLWIFAAAGGLIVGITILAVCIQSIRAATVNPIHALRTQ